MNSHVLSKQAKEGWDHIKSLYQINDQAINSLMDMMGLGEVKTRLVKIAFRVISTKSHTFQPLPRDLSLFFVGNPGTGKSSVAEHYIRFLQNHMYVNCPVARFGRDECTLSHLPILTNKKRIVFIDNFDDIETISAYRIAVDIQRLQDDTVFIFIASESVVDTMTAELSGLGVIVHMTIHFSDFSGDELRWHFDQEITKRYGEPKELEDSHVQILIQRMLKMQGTTGLSNIWLVRETVAKIMDRQSKRIYEGFLGGNVVYYSVLTREDVIGPSPSKSLQDIEAWQKLQKMVGLKSVKTAVESLIHQLQWNYERELQGLAPNITTTNRLFLGNPGTGKTTVAKLYAQILADAGLLSSSEVMVKTPADFIGRYIGHSEANTKKILKAAMGKVLVIDEAYMLGNSGDHDKPDIFRTAVIDTLVGEIQDSDNQDRCILLLGYRRRMENMFRNTNPGLPRRFPISSAFEFEDYTNEELHEILELKLAELRLEATDEAKKVAMEILERARNSTMFGNAGEVDNLLSRAKERQLGRLRNDTNLDIKSMSTLEAQDMDADFNRAHESTNNVKESFEGMVGLEALVEKLEGWQILVQNARATELDPRDLIPFNFLFRGPPGTGKTTTARKMGGIFYDLGFLATMEIVECSASDLIGQYAGQTGPKTRKVFEKALGKVLFIDEAYRLASDSGHNSFASEAVGEMVDILTQDRFRNKLVVILAGYEKDIDKLLATNPGLSSRFPETVDFQNLTPAECGRLLFQSVKKNNKLNITFPQQYVPHARNIFAELASLPYWGNARDVQTLAKRIINKVLLMGSRTSRRHGKLILGELKALLDERQERARNMTE
ncbi:ATPases of the AAA+ class [Hypoxylon trugodes]|uniref:ATPases of the AAA+ class n=1 Tax=Hypoxylon trugodes TaxID=326681 RepID=UPI00219133FE|nr:ATPases of the AAA+ class [Hypoxylon trugodes]KAI1385856.1 ATPases of the AAA+ class [Hypoxylon trugodes]